MGAECYGEKKKSKEERERECRGKWGGWGLRFKGESPGKVSLKRWHLIKELKKVRTTHGARAFQVEEQPMQRPRGRLGVGCHEPHRGQ